MAVDSRDKRMSMIGFGRSTPLLMQNPTGTIGAPARSMLLNLYSAYTLAVSSPTTLSGITQTVGMGAENVWYEEGLGQQESVSKKTVVDI